MTNTKGQGTQIPRVFGYNSPLSFLEWDPTPQYIGVLKPSRSILEFPCIGGRGPKIDPNIIILLMGTKVPLVSWDMPPDLSANLTLDNWVHRVADYIIWLPKPQTLAMHARHQNQTVLCDCLTNMMSVRHDLNAQAHHAKRQGKSLASYHINHRPLLSLQHGQRDPRWLLRPDP